MCEEVSNQIAALAMQNSPSARLVVGMLQVVRDSLLGDIDML